MTPEALTPRRNGSGSRPPAFALCALALLLIAAMAGQAQTTQTQTSTPSPTPTATPSATPAPSPTSTPSAAQTPSPTPTATPSPAALADPRVGLKAGLHNAGTAVRNMKLIARLPKPEGFYDPKSPAGIPTPPERPRPANTPDPDETPANESRPAATEAANGNATGNSAAPTSAAAPGRPSGGAPNANAGAGLSFANSDLVFKGDHLIVGSFHGFNTYALDKSAKPKLLASVVCPGGQGDVSIHGNLLFMSVEQTRGRIDCGTEGVKAPVSAERFRGVRIFDISNLRKPKQIAAVQTCRGSHTHTLVTSPTDTANVYIYGSGTAAVRSGEELAACSGLDPQKDPNTALFSIDVIQVPLAAPETAKIVNRPRIFADPATGNISALWPGGDHGPGT